jgi:hypothetical protein
VHRVYMLGIYDVFMHKHTPSIDNCSHPHGGVLGACVCARMYDQYDVSVCVCVCVCKKTKCREVCKCNRNFIRADFFLSLVAVPHTHTHTHTHTRLPCKELLFSLLHWLHKYTDTQ